MKKTILSSSMTKYFGCTVFLITTVIRLHSYDFRNVDYFLNLFTSNSNQIDDKPDFVTTFDLLKLLDVNYAMKQYYCVVNQDTCDSVGLRLKGTIWNILP